MVEFVDGSIKAQLGVPDMHLPIRYALGFPQRLPASQAPLQLSQYSTLTFEAPDYAKFPLLGYAFDAIAKGGNMPCILNAANEKAVAAFLKGRIRFVEMPVIAQETMLRTPFIADPDLPQLVATHEEASRIADDILTRMQA